MPSLLVDCPKCNRVIVDARPEFCIGDLIACKACGSKLRLTAEVLQQAGNAVQDRVLDHLRRRSSAAYKLR